MNPRIRTALDNVERHESKAQAFMKKAADSKGLVIPLALTAGAGLLAMAVPTISSSISSFVDLVQSSANSVGVMRDSHPKIFFGLASGLVAAGALLAGIGYLESRDEKKNARAGLDAEAAKNFEAAWESIVQTNSSITNKVTRQQAWAANSLVSNPETNGILRKNGINPQDRAALIDLQKAYIHGVKLAFVTASEDGKRAEISGSTFDQYTNKNIMRGMVSYYKDLGYSTTPGLNKNAEAFEVVSSGISAIREIMTFQGTDPAPLVNSRNRHTSDNTLSR